MNVAAARAAVESARAWTKRTPRQAALRRGLDRPAQQDALAVAERGRSRLPRGDVRRGARRVRRAGARAHRGRGRRPPRRDDLRHAQRQGGARRHRGRLRGARHAPARHDLGDHHRQERPHALGADGRGVLDLGRSRAAAVGRRQLRPRRARDAPVRRGARAASPTPSSAATRTPASPTRSASTTRRPTRRRCSSAQLADEGLVNIVGGCCGTTPDHIRAIAARVEGVAPRVPPDARPSHALVRPRAARRPARLRTSSMIGERTNVTGSKRFAELVKAGDYAQGGRGRARSGARRRQHPRRQHGRGDARRRARDDDVPQPPRQRAGDRAHPGHGRQLEVDASSRPASSACRARGSPTRSA